MQETLQNTVGNGQRSNTPAEAEVTAKPERQRKERTPKPMIPQTVEESKPTGKTQREEDIDVTELVAAVCTAKASVGQSFTGRKAGQPIAAAVASRAKVMLGLEPSKHVSDKLWKCIQLETDAFIEARLAEATVDYPEVVSIRLNVPTIKIDGKTSKAKDFLWQSRVARAREAANWGDERVGVNMLLRSANDRLEYMTGKRKTNGKYVVPSKTYTKEEIDAVEARVKSLTERVSELTSLIDKAQAEAKPKGKAK